MEDDFFRDDVGGLLQLKEQATSDKSKRALKSSTQHFNDFLCKTTNKYRDIDELTEEQFCNIKLFTLFGSYLSGDAFKVARR